MLNSSQGCMCMNERVGRFYRHVVMTIRQLTNRKLTQVAVHKIHGNVLVPGERIGWTTRDSADMITISAANQ